jgi:enoyl-CoA hydratase/carnithine racemase
LSDSTDILFDVTGRVGMVVLNRPDALNTLTHAMCVALHGKLDEWAASDDVDAVVVRGNGERAFCAGGDVVALYESGQAWKAGDESSTGWRDFFHDEYLMNAAIHHFPKPYISLLDGITMGGGVGIAVHGSHRIATERTMLAMPETGLGLFPDVGGGYFLPRLPGAMGMYLALTGQRVLAADCCYLGITQVFVPSDDLDKLVKKLAGASSLNQYSVDDILEDVADDPGETKVAPHAEDIDRLFAGETLEEIMAGLEKEEGEWAAKELARLNKKSPTSMKVTFRQLREGKRLAFDDNMRMEFRLAVHTLAGDDFYEGVRAILIDKDNAPNWAPAALDQVSDADIEKYFAALPQELNIS